MKLDRTTYEAWLLDRLEGGLSAAQERELDAFLAANPDLAAADDVLPNVQGDTVAIDWKNELKKSFPPTGDPDPGRLDDFLAARLEGGLTLQQERALDKLLFEHPEFEQSARRMAASKVRKEDVRFPEHGSIQRHFPPQGLPDRHRTTDFLIAAQEGDLNEMQVRALRTLVRNDKGGQREERLVKAARVLPEMVVFPGKELLKKREARVITMRTDLSRSWFRYAAAASIALLLGLAWWALRDRTDAQRVATIEKRQEHNVQLPTVTPVPAPAPTPALPVPEHVVPLQHRSASSGTNHKPSAGSAPDAVPATPSPMGPNAPAEQQSAEPQLAERPASSDEPGKRVKRDEPAPTQAGNGSVAPQAGTGSEGVQGVSLAAFAANAVRKEIGEAPRAAGLDQEDALAAVNKGLDAITGGKGELQVQQSATRKRFKLRLGNGFAITASNGR